MNQNTDNKGPESSFYLAVSMAVIFIFVAITAFLLLSLAGFKPDFLRETPETVTAAIPNIPAAVTASPVTSAATSDEPVEPPVSVRETDAEIQAFIDAEQPREIEAFAASNFESKYPGTVLGHTDDGGHEYLSRIVFLGDSTTYGLKKYELLSGGKESTQVWTPLNGTLTLAYAGSAKVFVHDTDEEMTIAEAVKFKKPDILVVTLGINGVSFMDETYFTSEYTKLVKNIAALSPDTLIILQSIFPIARSYTKTQSINNDKITAANGWIVALADSLAEDYGVRYLDTASALRGEDGYLPETLQNGDGMHLNKEGYEIELDYIRVHTYK